MPPKSLTIFSEIKTKKNSEILEYGCGAGAFLSFFYDKKYILNGIDFSESLIRKGKKYFPKIKNKPDDFSFSGLKTALLYKYNDIDDNHFTSSCNDPISI